MKRTVHIINSLEIGGAERMLQKLVSAEGFRDQEIFSMLEKGRIGGEIESTGHKVTALHLRKNLFSLRALFRADPDVIVAWMYHSGLLAAFYKILRPRVKLIWNIRHSLHDLRKEKRGTRIVILLLSRLRFLADAVIFNSHVALEQHRLLIAENARALVVPNGFEPERFKPSASGRTHTIGIFARFHPMKGHAFFLEAFSVIKEEFPAVKIRLVGEGLTVQNDRLTKLISALGLTERVILAGASENMVGQYEEIDYLVIPSLWGEGFPNVLGEAMLMEKECLVSDIGDSARILNKPGLVFEAGNREDLVEKLRKLLSLSDGELRERGRENRRRIMSNFSLSAVAGKMQKLIGDM